jgi:hypothetical protein
LAVRFRQRRSRKEVQALINTRQLRGLAAFALLVLGPTLATSGGECTDPPNEVCESATVFTNADLPYEIMAPLGCTNDVVDTPYHDVFYRFDCTESGTYTMHMCNSSGDTYLRVYSDGCGWGDGVELAVADDECPGSPPNADPMLTIDLEAGQSYWLELGTWRPDPPWAPPLNSPYNLSVQLRGTQPGLRSGGVDLSAGPDAQLRIAKDGADLVWSWGESCIATDTDYSIYRGAIPGIGQHEPFVCSTAGATRYTNQAPEGDLYFLVTPHNGVVGGSYGQTSAGAERPKGSPVCLPRFFEACP